MALEKTTLDNGLKLYVDQVPGSRGDIASLAVPYGSVNESPGEEGLAHALEHLVHYETDLFVNTHQRYLEAKLSRISTDAATGYTQTRYRTSGRNLPAMIDYLSQVGQRSRLSSEGLTSEMRVIRREAAMRRDYADVLHPIVANHAVFGGVYGRSVIGYHGRLDFDIDQLEDARRRHYKIGSMALVVAGRSDMAAVMPVVERYFGDIEADNDNSGDSNPGKTPTLLTTTAAGCYGVIRQTPDCS